MATRLDTTINSNTGAAHGFTLVEALLAAAIIGFIALPLTTALLNAARSTNFSYNAYNATLHANSLFIEIKLMLESGEEIRLPDNMSEYYELDDYDYIVKADDLKTGVSVEYATNPEITCGFSATCENSTLSVILNPSLIAVISSGGAIVTETRSGTDRGVYLLLIEVRDKMGGSLAVRTGLVFI